MFEGHKAECERILATSVDTGSECSKCSTTTRYRTRRKAGREINKRGEQRVSADRPSSQSSKCLRPKGLARRQGRSALRRCSGEPSVLVNGYFHPSGAISVLSRLSVRPHSQASASLPPSVAPHTKVHLPKCQGRRTTPVETLSQRGRSTYPCSTCSIPLPPLLSRAPPRRAGLYAMGHVAQTFVTYHKLSS